MRFRAAFGGDESLHVFGHANLPLGELFDLAKVLLLIRIAEREGNTGLSGTAGPADPGDTGTAIFLHSIQLAKRRLWLATPYFLPTPPVLAALRTAVLRGVQVKVIIPTKRDLFLPYLAAFTYLPEALAAGIEIHLYEPGYSHQKVMLIDEEISWVGSSNLDARSMELNFEGNLVVFSKCFAATVEAMLLADLARTRRMTADDFQRGFLFDLGVRFSRLFVNIL